jgi:hypothetical protein
MTVWTNSPITGVSNPAPQLLFVNAIPSGIAPTGSVAANGALSLGTNLDTTYSGGIWLMLPAGAAYAASPAGLYWCVMSGVAAGTIYNNVYTSPGPLTPPVTPTPIVAAGPGAFTGVTTLTTLVGVTIPGGSMGPNGYVRISGSVACNNSATSKAFGTIYAGGAGIQGSNTTNVGGYVPPLVRVQNRGSTQIQVECGTFYGSNASSTSPIPRAVNTTQDQTLSAYATVGGTGTDWVIWSQFNVEVCSG